MTDRITVVGRTAGPHPPMIADLPRVQCLHTEVVADPAVRHLRTVAVVDARCLRMVVAADTPCHLMVEVGTSVGAVRHHMAVEAEVTHPRTEEVAVVDVLPAAESAAMPRLRAAVADTAAEAGGPTMVAAITDITKI